MFINMLRPSLSVLFFEWVRTNGVWQQLMFFAVEIFQESITSSTTCQTLPLVLHFILACLFYLFIYFGFILRKEDLNKEHIALSCYERSPTKYMIFENTHVLDNKLLFSELL